MPWLKLDGPGAEVIRALADPSGCLAVRVTPGARTDSLEIADSRLLAKVRAAQGPARPTPPCSPSSLRRSARLRLLRGASSREKLFGMDRS